MFVCCQAGLEGRGVIAELEDMVGLMDFQPNVKDYHLLAVIGTTSPGLWEHADQGPVLLTLLRHVARILANGRAAFFESCDTIGWNSCDVSQKR